MKLGYGARDVALLGDSAGGNLALVLTQTLGKAGRHAAAPPGARLPVDGHDLLG